eukprot:TRINITY_DN3406_c0_g1_i2.p1 TRINITY_DN3406_c0_g1~~TRINITY_DN3406_c0_g1_i2.p1  ORF type:complete len:359 (-),score=79.84 TRINITY_DN3406_c0_g1_i2:388-1464(-)
MCIRDRPQESFFFSSRRRHTRSCLVSWARRCVQETGTWGLYQYIKQIKRYIHKRMQSGHHLDKKTLILSAGALLLIPPALLALYKSLNTKPGPPQPDARSSFATVSATEPRESLVNSLSLEDNASWAVIELGGTSIRVAIAKKVYKQGKLVEVTISDRQVFKTKDPAENVQEIAAYLKSKNFEKLGIASFGPVCLNEFDPSFGYITFTPKKTWQHFPILPELRSNLSSSLRESKMDTDVNASAIAEFLLGDHNVKDSIAYITVGTGIGVGLIINGRTVHGAMHPEGGHIRQYPLKTFIKFYYVRRVKIHEKDAGFKGVCPFHEDCVERDWVFRSMSLNIKETICNFGTSWRSISLSCV